MAKCNQLTSVPFEGLTLISIYILCGRGYRMCHTILWVYQGHAGNDIAHKAKQLRQGTGHCAAGTRHARC